MIGISIFIPAYNEEMTIEKNIPKILEEIRKLQCKKRKEKEQHE